MDQGRSGPDAAPPRPPAPAAAPRSPFRTGFFAALGAALAVGAVLLLPVLASVLVMFLIAGLLATGLNRGVAFLVRKGMRHGPAVAAVLLGALAVAALFVAAIVPAVIEEVTGLVGSIGDHLDALGDSAAFAAWEDRSGLAQSLATYLTPDRLQSLAGGLLGGAASVAGVVFTMLTVTVLTLYLLVGYDRTKTTLLKAAPASKRHATALLVDDVLAKVGGYITGAIAVALCAGITSYLLMALLGTPYPLALALVVACLDLIPQIGATLGATVCALVTLTVSLPAALAAVVFFVIYQQVENYLIYPRVMNRTVQVSSLAAVASVLIGGALAGILGALVAVPACAALQLIARATVLPRLEAR